MKFKKIFSYVLILLSIQSSSGNGISDQKNYVIMKADLREIFNGDVKGWGLYYDFFGRKQNEFILELNGKWNGNEGIVDEVFNFDNGEKLKRTWNINYVGENSFYAVSEDVVGKAVGEHKGSSIHTAYTLVVPFYGYKLELAADDIIYKVDEKSSFSIITLKKFGIKLGKFIIFLQNI